MPKLKFEKDLVCHPCHHGKMVAASHPPMNQVLTKEPSELHHMDIVGSVRWWEVVRSSDRGQLFSLLLGVFHGE